MKKVSLLTLPLVAAAALSSEGKPQRDKGSEKPNIILILADDLGYGDLSCYNPEGKIPTPNVDALAREGVMFTDAHASSALSTPSRYSVLTGRYPWRTTSKEGVLGGYSGPMIAPERRTIATELSELGYETLCIGKWHLGWDWTTREDGSVDYSAPIHNGPTTRGFDHFFGIAASLDMAPYMFVRDDKATEQETTVLAKDGGVHLLHGGEAGASFKPEECLPELTRSAVDEVRSWKGDPRPHFLYLPLTAPHTPCLPSPEFKGRTGLGDYGDFVAMMDDVVGQVLKAVKSARISDNTIVVFASDNGCAPYADTKKLEKMGHHPSYIFRGYKNDIYEGGHRIPLIFWGKPAVSRHLKGSSVDELVTLADLYSTFTLLAGGTFREGCAEDSFSLIPLLRGQDVAHDYIVSVSGRGFFSIRNRQYKLIFTPGSGGWSYPSKPSEYKGLPERQLYDILNDPSETVNLISEPTLEPMVKALTKQLQEYIRSGRTTKGSATSNDTPYLWKQNEAIFK